MATYVLRGLSGITACCPCRADGAVPDRHVLCVRSGIFVPCRVLYLTRTACSSRLRVRRAPALGVPEQLRSMATPRHARAGRTSASASAAHALRLLRKRVALLPARGRLAVAGAAALLAATLLWALAGAAWRTLAGGGRVSELDRARLFRSSGRFQVARWKEPERALKVPAGYGVSHEVIDEVLGHVREFIAGGTAVDWEALAESASVRRMHGTGIGTRDGEPLWTPTPFDFTKETEAMKRVAHTKSCFNKRRSDSLPLTRDIPDVRDSACTRMWYYEPEALPGVAGGNEDKARAGFWGSARDKHSPEKSDSKNTALDVSELVLPDTSVVFVMYNEPLSPLLRSVYSVLDRTPPQLLREIIIVDDGSDEDAPWLAVGGQFEQHIAYLPKVKLARLVGRNGLMRARNVGIALAKGDTITVLDSHIEVNEGWLQPLMGRIAEGKAEGVHRVVVPAIDSIDADNFKYTRGGIDILGHSWTLGQVGVYRTKDVVGTAPMSSPIMAGGLLALDRLWFNELGYYDPLMRLWGGEETEISFRIWQCGGTLECVPCSRVGHIFRSSDHWQGQVYKVPGEEVTRNKLRTASIWMDEYAALVKLASAPLPKDMEIGSLDYMRGVRNRLQCRGYRWYLDNVFPEILPSADRLMGSLGDGTLKANGYLRSPGLHACVDTLNRKTAGEPIGAYPCHGLHGTQALVAAADGTIVVAELTFSSCLTRHAKFAEEATNSSAQPIMWPVVNGKCDNKNRLQRWVSYYEDNAPGRIYEKEAEGGAHTPRGCLTVVRQAEVDNKSPYRLVTQACVEGNKDQLWEWETIGAPREVTGPPRDPKEQP